MSTSIGIATGVTLAGEAARYSLRRRRASRQRLLVPAEAQQVIEDPVAVA